MSETRPKKCSHCQVPTTIHLTKVVNGEAVKLGVCSNCPKAKQFKEGNNWDLIGTEDGGSKPKSPRENERACLGCGLTPTDFKETGRLGCPKCYETFEGKLEPVIKKLHKGDKHIGKTPGSKPREFSAEELEELKQRLTEYVIREDYEMAAVVRDQIRELETQ